MVTLLVCQKTQSSFILSLSLNPDYAIEITKPAQIIASWAFTKNHRLTYRLTSNSLQAPTTQALALILAILLHNSG